MITFKQAQKNFCRGAKRWAVKQPNLATAWRNCRVGAWMAWWLLHWRYVDVEDLKTIAYQLGLNHTYLPNKANRHLQLAYAKEIRRLYHPSGKLR